MANRDTTNDLPVDFEAPGEQAHPMLVAMRVTDLEHPIDHADHRPVDWCTPLFDQQPRPGGDHRVAEPGVLGTIEIYRFTDASGDAARGRYSHGPRLGAGLTLAGDRRWRVPLPHVRTRLVGCPLWSPQR